MEIQDLNLGLSVVYNSETENVCRFNSYPLDGFMRVCRLEPWNGKTFSGVEQAPFNKLSPIFLHKYLLFEFGFDEIMEGKMKGDKYNLDSCKPTNIFRKVFELDKNLNYPFYGIYNVLYVDLNTNTIILKENAVKIKNPKSTIIYENSKEELSLHFLQKIIWDYFKVDLFKGVKIDKKVFTKYIFSE